MIFFIRVQISGNKDTEFFKILLENLPHMNSPNKKKNGELQHNWSTVWVPAHKLKQKKPTRGERWELSSNVWTPKTLLLFCLFPFDMSADLAADKVNKEVCERAHQASNGY